MNTPEIFKCGSCGMIAEILSQGHAAECDCGSREKLGENTVDASWEKHLPVITQTAAGILVAVGSSPHPMTPEHFIEWIEVIDGNYLFRCHLAPGDAPQAVFPIPLRPGLTARAFCNIHGLWKSGNP